MNVLHREKYSVLPVSALALSTALLTAKRTEELRAIGGSPTASKKCTVKKKKKLLSLNRMYAMYECIALGALLRV